ncbi:protein FAR1-RELATED SEQUENCE 5-like [Tasmannia lanceolata]|uniref:protein FAR1-RELATED SEQUENCE 5-like n=1 Tax=Tasmannia lanceolata TaxID=3420 RepID=UPI004062B6C9
MFGKAPGAIITDMDGAMRNAVRSVFPNTRHRFYTWHIHKHLIENVAAIRDADSELHKDYNCWFYRREINECEMERRKLVEKYKIGKKNWVAKMWEPRAPWMPAYWRDTLTVGMSSSGRSKIINDFFDGYINQKTHLHEFLDQYDNTLVERCKKESKEDLKSKNSDVVLSSSSLWEAQAGKYYTGKIFKLFQDEMNGRTDLWHKRCSKIGTVTT